MKLISLMCAYREAKRSRQRKTKRDVELDRLWEKVENEKALKQTNKEKA